CSFHLASPPRPGSNKELDTPTVPGQEHYLVSPRQSASHPHELQGLALGVRCRRPPVTAAGRIPVSRFLPGSLPPEQHAGSWNSARGGDVANHRWCVCVPRAASLPPSRTTVRLEPRRATRRGGDRTPA